MNVMKAEGYKFPVMRESDAMFSADSAPDWADGEVCHRCRAQFSLVLRKHHCRACGQVFCGQCSSKTSTLPKFGIEKEVRVCDTCYEQVNKPKTMASSKDADMEEYLKSSLAQQSQAPPRKTEEEIREEEELQLALALSQSEAEAKEKEKLRATSGYFTNFKETSTARAERSPSPEELPINPELARYLNRSYWESKQENAETSSPSAPATAPSIISTEAKIRENGVIDTEIDEFVKTLKSQVEIFINRMKSNSSRGRSIANDSSVQTLFMNITAMHSKLLGYIGQHDDSRLYYERLQDKLTQFKDARAALDALREEHREKLRRQAEEAERQRQMLMAHKLDIMRKKKQEYLQYQRQLALQRIQEQEREMQMRQEQQKQQYMAPQYYMGSPIHGQQFPPNSAPPYGYQYNPMIGQMVQMAPQSAQPPNSMPMGPPGYPQHPNMPQGNMMPPNQMMPPSQNAPSMQHPQHPATMQHPQQMQHPQGMPPNSQAMPPPNPQNMQPPPNSQAMQPPNPQTMQHPQAMPPPNQQNMPQPPMHNPQTMGQNPPGMQPPQNPQAMPPNSQNPQAMGHPIHYPQQPGAPPASPQIKKEEADTAELISFD